MPRLLKRVASVAAVLAAALVGSVSFLYLTNTPPAAAPVSLGDLASSSKPVVVKLHAQWCPVCMVTKGNWTEVEREYDGRVHFVVLDFTTDADVDASAAEAKRLGFGEDFDEHLGGTGGVVVLDGPTRRVLGSVYGNVETAQYRAVIDQALAR